MKVDRHFHSTEFIFKSAIILGLKSLTHCAVKLSVGHPMTARPAVLKARDETIVIN